MGIDNRAALPRRLLTHVTTYLISEEASRKRTQASPRSAEYKKILQTFRGDNHSLILTFSGGDGYSSSIVTLSRGKDIQVLDFTPTNF